ncbi:unnamed protein product [Phytomonas sp. Hart1]|nr:unnamed protein product [Phytomonas sp. Hart1]|eukprot:CCW70348.1 unnamed protein product [Phytomonas sp. isolate Hart1]
MDGQGEEQRQRARLLQRKGLSLMRLTNPRLSESDSKAVMLIVAILLKIPTIIDTDVNTMESRLRMMSEPTQDSQTSSLRCNSPRKCSTKLSASNLRDSIYDCHPVISDSSTHENSTIELTIPVLSHLWPGLLEKKIASACLQCFNSKSNNSMENPSHNKTDNES